jgi:hypothetical protein
VKLKRSDNDKVIDIPLEKLSEPDQAFVEALEVLSARARFWPAE